MFKKSSVYDAVKANDIAKLQKHTKKSGFIKNATKEFDKAGYSALTQAALLSEPQMIKIMLDANIDPNTKDKLGRTPLYVAALCDRPEVARVLTENEHCDIDVECEGRTAMDAANENSKEVAKVIGDVIGNWLVKAAKDGDLEKVRELVKRPMINLEASDMTGWTALHFAMRSNFEDMVEVLAAAGAIGTYKNMAGETPLDIARRAGNSAIIKLYEETHEGRGRLSVKEREREQEPEKQIGVLHEKPEGTSDATFVHKKITQEELVKMERKAAKKKEREFLAPLSSPRGPTDGEHPTRSRSSSLGGILGHVPFRHHGERHDHGHADSLASPRKEVKVGEASWKHIDDPEFPEPKDQPKETFELKSTWKHKNDVNEVLFGQSDSVDDLLVNAGLVKLKKTESE